MSYDSSATPEENLSRMRSERGEVTPQENWIRQYCTIVDRAELNLSISKLREIEWYTLQDTFHSNRRSGDPLLLIDTFRNLVYRVNLTNKSTQTVAPGIRYRIFSDEVWNSIVRWSGVAKTSNPFAIEEVLSIDEEARKVIYGDREKTYGHPSKNLQLIADFWTPYLGLKKALTCDDVCNMMILMKTARLKNMPDHRDSLVDTIGYTLLKERCREKVKDDDWIEPNNHTGKY